MSSRELRYWYGMELLTNGSLPLKATLLADGITVDYFNFGLLGIDFHDEIGAKPFGEGLETWVKGRLDSSGTR